MSICLRQSIVKQKGFRFIFFVCFDYFFYLLFEVVGYKIINHLYYSKNAHITTYIIHNYLFILETFLFLGKFKHRSNWSMPIRRKSVLDLWECIMNVRMYYIILYIFVRLLSSKRSDGLAMPNFLFIVSFFAYNRYFPLSTKEKPTVRSPLFSFG